MFQITINEKGGPQKMLEFDKNEITIGRVQGNDIVLPKGNISKRHSRIVVKDGKFIIIDMQSTNGTYVNGKKITTPQVVKATDKIYIGDFTLQLTGNGGAAADARPATKGKAAAEEELDLDGGGGGNGAEAPAQRSAKPSTPGLIDDNFDQEFEGTAEPEPAPPPAKAAPPLKKPAPKIEEPESEGMELDLGGGEPAAEEHEEDDAPPEPEPEPEEKPAPVVPLKQPPAAAKKPAPVAAVQSRGAPSRVKPLPQPATKLPAPKPAGREERADSELDAAPPAAARQAPVIVPSAPPGISEPPMAGPGPIVPPPPASTAAPVGAAAPAAVVGSVVAVPSAGNLLERKEAVRRLHAQLVDELGLRGVELRSLGEQKDRALEAAKKAAERMRGAGWILADDVESIAKDAVNAACDFETIQDLLEDENVLELVITHQREIWAERGAQLEKTGRVIDRDEDVIALAHRFAALGGMDPTKPSPLVDVRLRDGSRVVASLPPLSFRGPTLSLRRATREAFEMKDLLNQDTLSDPMWKFIDYCIQYRKGVLLCVGPGVSASATLNALARQIAVDERLVTVESGVELSLTPEHGNVTAFEPNKELGIGALAKHALALQPDRALFGLISGSGVADVLTSMSVLEGCMACYSAANAQEAVQRLLDNDLSQLPPREARRLLTSGISVILHEQRFADGSRRIAQISELVLDGEEVKVDDIFVFEPAGLNEDGLVTGEFRPTGTRPRFFEELNDRGLEVNMGLFEA